MAARWAVVAAVAAAGPAGGGATAVGSVPLSLYLPPDIQHLSFRPHVQAVGPVEFGAPQAHAHEDEKPAGAGRHQHDNAGDDAQKT